MQPCTSMNTKGLWDVKLRRKKTTNILSKTRNSCFVGASSRFQQVSDSQQLSDSLTERLQERLRAARVSTTCKKEQSSFTRILHEFNKVLVCIKITSCLFQLNVDKNQQQKASLEPVSRLQSLRDRDTVTRFDPEVRTTTSLAKHYTSFKLWLVNLDGL